MTDVETVIDETNPAATVGGPIETMLVWLVDLLRAMPGVLLALLLAAVLGSGVMPL